MNRCLKHRTKQSTKRLRLPEKVNRPNCHVMCTFCDWFSVYFFCLAEISSYVAKWKFCPTGPVRLKIITGPQAQGQWFKCWLAGQSHLSNLWGNFCQLHQLERIQKSSYILLLSTHFLFGILQINIALDIENLTLEINKKRNWLRFTSRADVQNPIPTPSLCACCVSEVRSSVEYTRIQATLLIFCKR